jgi:SpoVK/Ycf46/Vps4 family AAA+-type ATPase
MSSQVNTKLRLVPEPTPDSKHSTKSVLTPPVAASVRFLLRAALYTREGRALLMRSHNADDWLAIVGPWLDWPRDALAALANEWAEDRDVPVTNVDELIDEIDWSQVMWTEFAHSFTRFFGRKPQPVMDAVNRLLSRPEIAEPGENCPICKNIAMFAQLFSLTSAESEILMLSALMSGNRQFKTFISGMEFSGVAKAAESLSYILDLPECSVRAALSRNSNLYKTGLLQTNSSPNDLDDLLMLSPKIASVIDQEHETVERLINHFVRQPPPANLNLQDYPHFAKEIDDLTRIVGNAVSSKSSGINILIYGAPGTGKTELAKLLGELIGIPTYEVSTQNEDGAACDSGERYLSYILAQNFLETRGNSLVLFDEVEDVLCGDGMGNLGKLLGIKGSHDSTGRKAWINALLETNPVPAIWICNQIDSIDPAFLRRFIYHVEMQIPPRGVRKQIAQKHLGALNISSACINRLAQYDHLSPAQLENAAKVIHLAQPADRNAADELLVRNIHNSMHAMGQTCPVSRVESITAYSLDYLNIESRFPIEKIVEAIARKRSGSLCLYGPPGTGKTQLAHHLATATDQPILAKRASDLLGKYVGETENNIAAMFEEAKQESAVLLLDEADSFLRDRQGARQLWEVSQVNELLQQMEAFEGVFVCATNLFDQLDPAVLRRFNFKLYFKYLTLDQRISLCLQEAGMFDFDEVAYLRKRLNNMDTLTPGDFATVKRQATLMADHLSMHDFLGALEVEVTLKSRNLKTSKPIGFV